MSDIRYFQVAKRAAWNAIIPMTERLGLEPAPKLREVAMLEFHPENFRHACESGDQDAQLYAFWTHSRTGMAAARAGDAATVDSCRRALVAMIDFFEGLPVARQAVSAIKRMEDMLAAQISTADASTTTRDFTESA